MTTHSSEVATKDFFSGGPSDVCSLRVAYYCFITKYFLFTKTIVKSRCIF